MGEKPRCRVLVVEDEAMIAMLVEDMVLDFGSEVVGPVATMDDAINLARSADILSERGIPLIFATGYGSKGLPPRFQDSPTLPKPFSYQSLEEALRSALAGQPCHTEAV